MNKKFWLILNIFVLAALMLSACGSATTTQPAAASNPEPAKTEEAANVPEPAQTNTEQGSSAEVKVALLLTGPIADGGWDQLAYEGLEKLGTEGGFKIAVTENITQDKIPEVTRGYADDGFNLIIGHGFEYGSTFIEIAPDYPDQWFFATTFKPSDDIPSNLLFADVAYYDASYAAGALAALMSTSHAVGFVGGGDNPTQQNMMKAFTIGAEETVSGTKALGVVTGDYNDASKGREAAKTMIGNGADVIWHAADVTGLGAIQGAVESKAKVLGCYSDQLKLAPDSMGSSLYMDLGNMVIKLAHDVRDGKFAGGTEWKPSVKEMWHWQAGESDHNASVISDDVWAQFMQIWNDIDTHKIDVNSKLAE